MVSKKRAKQICKSYLYGQVRMLPIEFDYTSYDLGSIQQVLLHLGDDKQAYFHVYPDENLELMFLGERDDINLED